MSTEISEQKIAYTEAEAANILGDETLLEDEEAAVLLKVSARTVQRLRLKKKIKSVRITSKISRIKVAHVKEYLRKLERAA